MKQLIILIGLGLVGCGPGFQTVENQMPSSPELTPYIQDFESRYNVKANLPIYLAETESNIAGLCRIWSNGRREIQISKAYFEENKNDYYDIQEVVYHELGHCLFNLGHDSTFENSRPKSIMYPYAFGYSYSYKNNLQSYYEELYSKFTGEVIQPSVMGLMSQDDTFIDIH